MARGVVGSVLGYVRAHPYLTAGVAVAASEVMRSRDCPRSVASTLASLVALAATANAGVAAVGDVAGAVLPNPYRPNYGAKRNPSAPEPRSRYSPEGRLTALPIVKVSGLKAGTVVLGKKGKPAIIGAKGPKLGKDQVVVLGRWDRPQVITRSCGNSSGGPGTVLATGKSRKGCSRADAARVMGIKSWRDSLANTTLRQAAALNALKAAFKKRGIRPPAEFKTAAAQANDAARTLVKSNLAVMTQRRAAR